MRRNPQDVAKIQAERQNYYREQGVEHLVPLKGQSSEEAFEQIKAAGGKIQEEMAEAKEKKAKAKQIENKAKQAKRIKEAPAKFFKAQEEKKKMGL